MNKIILTVFFLFFYSLINAQKNLIADPGFDSVTCGKFVATLKYWYKIGNPLVCNSCLPYLPGAGSSSVPFNNPNPFSTESFN